MRITAQCWQRDMLALDFDFSKLYETSWVPICGETHIPIQFFCSTTTHNRCLRGTVQVNEIRKYIVRFCRADGGSGYDLADAVSSSRAE